MFHHHNTTPVQEHPVTTFTRLQLLNFLSLFSSLGILMTSFHIGLVSLPSLCLELSFCLFLCCSVLYQVGTRTFCCSRSFKQCNLYLGVNVWWVDVAAMFKSAESGYLCNSGVSFYPIFLCMLLAVDPSLHCNHQLLKCLIYHSYDIQLAWKLYGSINNICMQTVTF